MEKKYQIIYIWSFIIISGIVLLLLYTPLGGDLHYAAYSDHSRYAVAPGVNYSSQIGSLVGNSSGSSSSYGYYSAPSPYNTPEFKSISSANSSSFNSASGANSQGMTSVGLSSKYGKSKSDGGGSASSGFAGIVRAKSTEVNNTFADGGALGGSLLNNTTNGNTTVIQRGTSASEDPLDPGGDPTTDPLPLGNELGVLLTLALVYSVYKWRLIKK